jgi:hypothetical protein
MPKRNVFARLFPVPFRHEFVGNRGESARHERVSVAGRAAAAIGMRILPLTPALRVAVRIKSWMPYTVFSMAHINARSPSFGLSSLSSLSRCITASALPSSTTVIIADANDGHACVP